MALQKEIKGRLGNQMFQYATIKAFQHNYFKEQDVALSFKWNDKKVAEHKFDESDQLKYFHAQYSTERAIRYSFSQSLLVFVLSTILFIEKLFFKKTYTGRRDRIERKFRPTLLRYNIIWCTQGYAEFDLSLVNPQKNILFYGYFESPKYFDSIKNLLQKEFTPNNDEIDENKELYAAIRNSNSVCVSIRRGDFVTDQKVRSQRFVCDDNYFKEAVELMNSKIKNPRYIVFSDDVEWCKDNLGLPDGTLFESGKDPIWEKLRLMYSCKNFIISNSTFSWWAQYLSDNKEKIVIAPKVWSRSNPSIFKDIYEDTWTLV